MTIKIANPLRHIEDERHENHTLKLRLNSFFESTFLYFWENGECWSIGSFRTTKGFIRSEYLDSEFLKIVESYGVQNDEEVLLEDVISVLDDSLEQP